MSDSSSPVNSLDSEARRHLIEADAVLKIVAALDADLTNKQTSAFNGGFHSVVKEALTAARADLERAVTAFRDTATQASPSRQAKSKSS